MQKADGELLSSMFFLRLPIELMHERPNVRIQGRDAASSRRVPWNEVLDLRTN